MLTLAFSMVVYIRAFVRVTRCRYRKLHPS